MIFLLSLFAEVIQRLDITWGKKNSNWCERSCLFLYWPMSYRSYAFSSAVYSFRVCFANQDTGCQQWVKYNFFCPSLMLIRNINGLRTFIRTTSTSPAQGGFLYDLILKSILHVIKLTAHCLGLLLNVKSSLPWVLELILRRFIKFLIRDVHLNFGLLGVDSTQIVYLLRSQCTICQF